MIKVFYGDNRNDALISIKRELGDNYEVFDGEKIELSDFVNIFYGTSLFGDERKILIKDLFSNKELADEVVKYVDTPHEVIIWESVLDKRSSICNVLKKAKIEFVEFKQIEKIKKCNVFDIFPTALRNGENAVRMIDSIIDDEDPFRVVGLFVKQAIDNFSYRQGEKEKRVLFELSKLDIQMKSTSIESWDLIKTFLLLISSL